MLALVNAPQAKRATLRALVTAFLLVTLPLVLLYGARLFDTAMDYERTVARWAQDVSSRFESVPLLSDDERALLRRSRNSRHVALAESLGVPPVATRDSLFLAARDLGLVNVGVPSTRYQASSAQYSEPFLTPSAAVSLDTLGRRFHALLDSAGLPRYTLVVTSVLRSSEDQAALRGVNVNAASGNSSHEYATTYDVHYRRFGYSGRGLLNPPPPPESLPEFVRRPIARGALAVADNAFAHYASEYPSRLQALLGRALIALEDEGVLVTVMERGQPVFHTTVADSLAGAFTTETESVDAR